MKKTLGIVGRKIGMTRIYGADGNVIPVTVIQAGPCPVIEKRSAKKTGTLRYRLVLKKWLHID